MSEQTANSPDSRSSGQSDAPPSTANEIVTITAADGSQVDFKLGPETGTDAYFVMGVRKSGSTMLHVIITMMAHANKVPMVNLAGTFFRANVHVPDWITLEQLPVLLRAGHVYSGFRDYPEAFTNAPLFRSSPKLLMVRDPRDALVSEYFSNAYSHMIPQGDSVSGAAAMMLEHRAKARETPIDDYVLERAPEMLVTMQAYVSMLNMLRLEVVRYEDIILNKKLLLNLITWHFNWRCPEPLEKAIMERVDVRPASEDPTVFTRRVTPGDHRAKLQQTTIDRLNKILAPVMGPFAYG